MNRWIVAVLLMAVATTSLAGEQIIGIKGDHDALKPYIGIRPGERTEVGLYGLYADGMAGTDEGIGAGVYATYDLIADANFTVLEWSVPATIYIGGELGGIWNNPDVGSRTGDVTAALTTGVLFGGDKLKIGVELSYALTEDLWKELSMVDPEARVLFNIHFRFK